MKIKLTILFALISFTASAQVYQAMPQAGYGPIKRILIDSVLTLPLDTTGLRNITGGRNTGQVRYNQSDSTLYVYTGSSWISMAVSAAGGDTTIYENVIDTTGQINQRVLFAKNRKISSDPTFIFNEVNNILTVDTAAVQTLRLINPDDINSIESFDGRIEFKARDWGATVRMDLEQSNDVAFRAKDSINTPANIIWQDHLGIFHKAAVPSGGSSSSGITSLGSGWGLNNVNDSTYEVDSTEVASKDYVDNKDALKLNSVVAGDNIIVDDTDPNNPIISSSYDSAFVRLDGLDDSTVVFIRKDGTADTLLFAGGNSSQWNDNANGIDYMAGNVGINNATPTAKLQISNSSTGATPAANSGFRMSATTAASNGSQQSSPLFELVANGWLSGSGGSSGPAAGDMYVLPVQGVSTGTAQWVFRLGGRGISPSTILTLNSNNTANNRGISIGTSSTLDLNPTSITPNVSSGFTINGAPTGTAAIIPLSFTSPSTAGSGTIPMFRFGNTGTVPTGSIANFLGLDINQTYNGVSGMIAASWTGLRINISDGANALTGAKYLLRAGSGGASFTSVFDVHTSGKLQIATGSNASVGISGAMTAGTITINTTAVTSSSIIMLTPVGAGTGSISLGTITDGTSFVINSSDNTDTRTVQWWIIN